MVFIWPFISIFVCVEGMHHKNIYTYWYIHTYSYKHFSINYILFSHYGLQVKKATNWSQISRHSNYDRTVLVFQTDKKKNKNWTNETKNKKIFVPMMYTPSLKRTQ